MNLKVKKISCGCLGIAMAIVLSLVALLYSMNRYLHPSLGIRPVFHVFWPSDSNHGLAPDSWRLRIPIHSDDYNNFVVADDDRNMLAAVAFEGRIPPNANSTMDRIVEVHPDEDGSVTISAPSERSWKVAIPEKPDTFFLILGESGEVIEFKLKKGGVAGIHRSEDVLLQIYGILAPTETKSIDQYLKYRRKESGVRIEK